MARRAADGDRARDVVFVDMLLSQIDPAAKKTLAREFSVSLKVFSAKQSTERAEGEDRVAVAHRWLPPSRVAQS